jgi:hypothetical protein
MLRMAVGHSDDVDPGDAIAAAIEQCRVSLGGMAPQAGILVSAFDSFEPVLVDSVREAFPGVAVMGSTSAAEVSSVSGFQEDSVVLALFASDTVDITVGLGTGLDIDVNEACRAAAGQAMATTKRDPKVCVVLTEGARVDPPLTLAAMARALPEGVVLVGGGSSRRDLRVRTPTYQFCNERVAEDGVAVLMFSGPVAYAAAIGTGWRKVGATGTVTRSGNGVVDEIDGRPALEFLARYLDVTGPASYGNPLAIMEAGSEEPYLRAVVGSDPVSGSVSLFGSVPVGATVQLTTANTEDILAGTKDALARATAEFPAWSHPEAALMFSCSVRRFLLGSRTKVETELALAEFGSTIPLAGMYCNGEIAPIRGTATSRFLNETFVTLLLGT